MSTFSILETTAPTNPDLPVGPYPIGDFDAFVSVIQRENPGKSFELIVEINSNVAGRPVSKEVGLVIEKTGSPLDMLVKRLTF